MYNNSNNDTILATRRGYGEFIDRWEFPGGKIEPGESQEDALIREIEEELSITVNIDNFVTTVDYDYPKFHLTMHCFLCSKAAGELTLNEHNDAKWINKSELNDLDWLPADLEIFDELKKYL